MSEIHQSYYYSSWGGHGLNSLPDLGGDFSLKTRNVNLMLELREVLYSGAVEVYIRLQFILFF